MQDPLTEQPSGPHRQDPNTTFQLLKTKCMRHVCKKVKLAQASWLPAK